jgi:hypothetical protein
MLQESQRLEPLVGRELFDLRLNLGKNHEWNVALLFLRCKPGFAGGRQSGGRPPAIAKSKARAFFRHQTSLTRTSNPKLTRNGQPFGWRPLRVAPPLKIPPLSLPCP